MEKNLTIIDKDYLQWVKDLALRYRQSQIKAAVKVNQEALMFYWELGKDIVEKQIDNKYGSAFYHTLSHDLRIEMPDVTGLSERNIRYAKNFYLIYNQHDKILQQVAVEFSSSEQKQDFQQSIANLQQVVADLCKVPWGHHCAIMDKVKGNSDRALFYVRKTIENGWSRSMLLNFLDTDLYEREGKALNNFQSTLPIPMGDLAKEITKDPYNFAFAGITDRYNEAQLKKAMLTNITDFLIELGSGFAYVGKEYRLQIGETENFIDLLFYHLQLRCYVVIEVKVDKFTPGDLGQLGTYVVACNHILKRTDDNPTIGLLICKDKDNTLAQYALEGTNQPLAISSYDLAKLYPTQVEGLIPTIEEIEAQLNNKK